MPTEIMTGDYKEVPFQLYRKLNGVLTTFDMSAATEVVLVLRNGNDIVSTQLTLASNDPGADWTTSLVTAVMDVAFTSAITLDTDEACEQYQVNIRVTQSGKPETWVIDEPITVLRGVIV